MCKFTNRLFVFTLLASANSVSEAANNMRHDTRFGLLAQTHYDSEVESRMDTHSQDIQQNDFSDESEVNVDQEDELSQYDIIDNDIQESLGATALVYMRRFFDQLWWFTLFIDRAADKHKSMVSTEDNEYPKKNKQTTLTKPTPTPKKIAKDSIWHKMHSNKGLAAEANNARYIKT